MDSYLQTILIILLIIIAFLYLFSSKKWELYHRMTGTIPEEYANEHFTPYSYGPFNYMDTGSDPLSFYKYPIFRNPFMYPYKFYSSYPYPYMTYFPTNI